MDTKEARRRGGTARAKKLTKAQRTQIAKMGGKARHGRLIVEPPNDTC
jgi:hypothetical protein